MRARYYRLWVLGAPLLVACGSTEEPVSGQGFALTAQENLEQALRGLYRAGSFVADSAALAAMLAPVVEGEGGDCLAVPGACPPGQVCPTTPNTGCGSGDLELDVDDLKDTRDEVNEAIDELVEGLRERVLTPENLESEDSSSATYRLGASFYCDDVAVELSDPIPGGAPPPPVVSGPDPDCIEQAARLETRLRLSSPSEGNIDVELLVTPERRNVATLELHQAHVAVAVDLGEYLAALRASAEDTGEIVALDGTVLVELRKNAELDYSLRYGVRDAVQFAAVDADNGETTELELGASFPALELRLDGNQRQLTGAYDLGTLGLKLPLENFHDDEDLVGIDASGNVPPPEPAYTGTIDAFLAGIEGSVTLDGNNDELRFVNLGLGDQSSMVKYNGQLIAALDVNPDTNRHFDVIAKKVDTERTTLTFAPGLDVRVLLQFAPLASQIPELPDYLLGDTLRAVFTGSEPAVEASDGQLKVVAGTLNVTSERVPGASLSVPAGSCLLDGDPDGDVPGAAPPAPAPSPSPSTPAPVPPAQTPEPAAPAHELLGRFSVGACQ